MFIFNKQFYLMMLFYVVVIFAGISTMFFILGGFDYKDIALLIFQVFSLSLIATISQQVYAMLSNRSNINKAILKLSVFTPILVISGSHYLIITLLYDGEDYVYFNIPWFFYNLIIPISIFISYLLYLKYKEVIYNNQLKKLQKDLQE